MSYGTIADYGNIATGGITLQQVRNEIYTQQGWARYVDTQYDVNTPFVIAEDAFIPLPNNAGEIINSQLPIGVDSFYDPLLGVILPDTDLDKLRFTFRFKAKTDAPSGGQLGFGIDIGGSLGVIFKDSRLFIKGANVEQDFTFDIGGYTGSTFLTNKGTPLIGAIRGNASIYDVELQIERTQKGR
tara:strand:+ start:956 stop:1510 length:555 start_codon:yes stop_codon:yes gene_type:complete